MTTENLANNATTTLYANVGPTDTSITVQSSSGFPSPNFRILIDAEIMLVTGVSGNVWSVTRAEESTVANSHTANASVAQVLTVAGLTAFAEGIAGSGGTVSSVGITMPSGFSVSGSPVTSSGTLAVTYTTETANSVLAGPSTGSAAAPTFRSLVAGDIPAIAESGVTNLTSDLAARLLDANNLSDVASASTARTNLGLGSAATHASTDFDATGAAATAQAASLQKTSNLSDLSSASTARTNLGLGSAAVESAGTFAQVANNLSDLASASTALTNLLPSQTGNSGKVLETNGTAASWTTPAASGVTSVAMTVPSFLSVSGSPITSSGTLAVSLATETANTIFAGPSTGSAAAPAFRALVAADIPAIAESGVTNLTSDLAARLIAANNLSDLASASTALTNILPSQTGNSGKVLETNGTAASWTTPAASGVTSVGLSLPSIITVSGSPVTSTGTLTGTLATQSVNAVFAGPTTGSAAAPAFRALVATDIPAIAESGVTNLTTDLAARANALSPAAVQTSNYAATANQLVPVNTTSGSITITLPTAPADKTLIAVKHVIQGGTNTVSITCGGSDVFNKTGGGTTATLTLVSQGSLLQYYASGAIWYVLADDLPLAQTDARYLQLANNLSDVASASTTLTNLGLQVIQTISYATTVTPVGSHSTSIVNVGTITSGGAVTFAAPSGSPADGNKLQIRLVQDSTGGGTMTWNSAYAFGSDITAALIPNTASSKCEVGFVYNGTDSKWRCLSLARGF